MNEKEMKDWFLKKFSEASYDYDEYEEYDEPKNEKYSIDKDIKKKLIAEGYTEQEIKENEKATNELFRKSDWVEVMSKKEESATETDFSNILWTELDEYDMYSMKRELELNKDEAKIFENIWYLKNMFYHSGKPIPDSTKYFALKALRGEVNMAEKFTLFCSQVNPSLLAEAKAAINDISLLEHIDIEYIDKKSKAANKAKNACKTIKIEETMPQKKLEKYNLEPGNMFESQQALADYCGITRKQVAEWKKHNYIEETEARSLSETEIIAMIKK